ncbi:unnamed protein product, partial [Prorocentrum cordatum]
AARARLTTSPQRTLKRPPQGAFSRRWRPLHSRSSPPCSASPAAAASTGAGATRRGTTRAATTRPRRSSSTSAPRTCSSGHPPRRRPPRPSSRRCRTQGSTRRRRTSGGPGRRRTPRSSRSCWAPWTSCCGRQRPRRRTGLRAVLRRLGSPSRSPPSARQDRKQAAKQPVQTQVSQKDMDAFVATLSSACGKQFNAIMAGSAPAIHTFGEVGVNSTEGGCGRLEGALCDTEAQIESAKSGPADRRMRSLHHVTGQGCLPSQCTQKDDLAALAGFMQSRAKEAVPGTGILVRLSVDCTGSGGATAKVGYDDGAGPTNQLHKALSTKSGAARGGAALAALAIGAAAAM